MNHHLTSVQVDEIVAASAYVDVPADRLLAAAAEIRAVLLGASDVVCLPPAGSMLADRADADLRVTDVVSRTRVTRTVLVAAAFTLATFLGIAAAGALPTPIQDPVSRIARFFGVDLPVAEPAAGASDWRTPAGTGRTGDTDANSPPRATRANAGTVPPQSNKGGNEGDRTEPTIPTNESSNAPSENPGNHYANGPPENNDNGPPENNDNGPPENNDNGNADIPQINIVAPVVSDRPTDGRSEAPIPDVVERAPANNNT